MTEDYNVISNDLLYTIEKLVLLLNTRNGEELCVGGLVSEEVVFLTNHLTWRTIKSYTAQRSRFTNRRRYHAFGRTHDTMNA